MKGLANRRALVTGAAGGGIGSAIVRRLVAEGCHVVATDSDAARLEELVGEGISTEVLDVSDRDAIERVADANRDVDLLVNSAAINALGRVGTLDAQEWRSVLEVDLTGPFLLLSRMLPAMRERGRGAIVNISSAAVYSGEFAGAAGAYNAAKAGLAALTRTVAAEAGRDGVRCNAVAPGIVRSPWVEAHIERFEAEVSRTPLGRFADPDEVASVIAFLLSEEASFITGETVVVSGGRMMRA